jgi:hypothetical protein
MLKKDTFAPVDVFHNIKEEAACNVVNKLESFGCHFISMTCFTDGSEKIVREK